MDCSNSSRIIRKVRGSTFIFDFYLWDSDNNRNYIFLPGDWIELGVKSSKSSATFKLYDKIVISTSDIDNVSFRFEADETEDLIEGKEYLIEIRCKLTELGNINTYYTGKLIIEGSIF